MPAGPGARRRDCPSGRIAGAWGAGQEGERERLLRVLQETCWNRTQAATRLGMHRTTLWRRMREWGLGSERVAR
ncbi:MAG: helix-turn-helix domain-containing protein [Candidatus Latescibacterota bacterium]